MLRHNLLIAFRNLKRHKGSFIINLIGLSTGLACTFLIFLWVTDELKFDKFHENDSRLYQVMELSTESGNVVVHETTQGPLAAAMVKDLPEVTAAVPVMSMQKVGLTIPLRTEEKSIKSSGMFAGGDFFKVFSFRLKEGTPAGVLSKKSAIVLSENLAQSLFGSSGKSIGKTINWEMFGKKQQAVVTGVFENPPAANSMQFDFVLTFDLLYNDLFPNLQKWWNEGPQTYLLLKSGTDIAAFDKKIENFLKTYHGETLFTLFVRPYSSAYLYSKYENGVQSGGRIEYVKLFSVVAVFILLIACINFMNLSTAKASRRLKEVGIKKAIGSTRRALVFQFLSEAILMALLSLLLACIIVLLLLPSFNQLTGKQISLSFDLPMVLIALGATLFTGIISGSYPAFYMSGFSVISVFRGKLKSSITELFARKGLVVFQFMISLALMVSMMIIYKQITYVQSKNIGFNRENVIHFDKEGTLVTDASAFIAELNKLPGVVMAAEMQQNIFQNNSGSSTYGISWPGKGNEETVDFAIRAIDDNLLETLGMQMKEGRSFSKKYGGEENKLIFNETAIRAMQLKNPIGTKVVMWGNEMTIVGVVKDFHVSSFHEPIQPLVFRFNPEQTSTIMARIQSKNQKETIGSIGALYKRFNPGYVFQYSFLDELYQAQYIAEQRIAVLSRYFAGLAIIISCLGLFGLAAFNAEVRTKEIGIRKVLGASVSSVMLLLSKDFMALMLISMLIAFPLSWWAMNAWLDGFAYRISIDGWVFFFAGATMIMLTVITVGYQSLKTALMNPVSSLRTE